MLEFGDEKSQGFSKVDFEWELTDELLYEIVQSVK